MNGPPAPHPPPPPRPPHPDRHLVHFGVVHSQRPQLPTAGADVHLGLPWPWPAGAPLETLADLRRRGPATADALGEAAAALLAAAARDAAASAARAAAGALASATGAVACEGESKGFDGGGSGRSPPPSMPGAPGDELRGSDPEAAWDGVGAAGGQPRALQALRSAAVGTLHVSNRMRAHQACLDLEASLAAERAEMEAAIVRLGRAAGAAREAAGAVREAAGAARAERHSE